MSSHESNAVSVGITVPGHHISINDMYQFSSKNNSSWGIGGYKVPCEYLDSKKIKAEREGSLKKVPPKPGKQGDYLTEVVKNASKTPGPNHYNLAKPWFDEKSKKTTVKNDAKKRTFLEEIELEAKRRPMPGPGAYDLRKKDEKKNTGKPRGGERDNFLNEYEYVSAALPGPGNYNPRPIAIKIREAKLKPEDWIKKHKEGSGKKIFLPDVGTYSPSPVSFDTFDRIAEKSKAGKSNSTKHWGTDVRFSFEKKSTNNKVALSPGPGQYNVLASWGPDPLKPQKDEKKNTNIFNRISKGISKSIYYS